MKNIVISIFFVISILNANISNNIDEKIEVKKDKLLLNISPYSKEINNFFKLDKNDENQIFDFQFNLNKENIILNDLKIFKFKYDKYVFGFGYKGLVNKENYYTNFGFKKEISDFDIISGLDINIMEDQSEYIPEVSVIYKINDYNKISSKMMYIDREKEILEQKLNIDYELNLYTKYMFHIGYKENLYKNDIYISLRHLF